MNHIKLQLTTDLLTLEYWVKVASAHARRNKPEERAVLASLTDWETWSVSFRSASPLAEPEFQPKDTHDNWDFGSSQYVLVKQVKTLRELWVVEGLTGFFVYKKEQRNELGEPEPNQFHMVELPPGYNYPTPTGEKSSVEKEHPGLVSRLVRYDGRVIAATDTLWVEPGGELK